MPDTAPFDLQTAHHYFSADCFNRAWDLIDKPVRTPQEDEEMLRLSLASHYHWTQRADCTPANLSVSCWQTSRIYVLIGQPENALRSAQSCWQMCQAEGVAPFYLGYAYEALARAEAAAGRFDQAQENIRQARQIAENITDAEMRQPLMDDLTTIPTA